MTQKKDDWNEVARLNPQGYAELNYDKTVIHGPVESVKVHGGNTVVIRLKWAAQATLGAIGLPEGGWKAAPLKIQHTFFNRQVPFVIEDTPGKGQRVRFGRSILYIDKQVGLDPSKVKGLVLKDQKAEKAPVADGPADESDEWDEDDAGMSNEDMGLCDHGYPDDGECTQCLGGPNSEPY